MPKGISAERTLSEVARRGRRDDGLDVRTGVISPWIVYPTAFLEGAAVIIIEIAGARALAPFFGTSLQVWTATITVTLCFLALGYGLGGVLANRLGGWMLPCLFATAGFWTALYPVWRTAILDVTSPKAGVAI